MSGSSHTRTTQTGIAQTGIAQAGIAQAGIAQAGIAQTGTPLVLRSVQRRPATAVLLLLITATAVLTLVLGPLLARAVHESALADALASAEPSQTTIAVAAPLAAGDLTPVSVVQTVLTAGRGAAPDIWQEPRTFFATSASAGWRPGASPRGETIASRITTSADPCLGYVLTAGRCPRAGSEVLLSAADSHRHRASVGTDLIVTVPDSRPFRLRVTGLYDPDRSDQAPLLRPGTDAGALAQVGADSLVVTMDQAAAINLPYRVTGRLLLRPGTPITVDREPDLRRTVDAVTLSMAAQSVVLEFDTGLPDLLNGVDAQSESARVLIAVTAVQAFGLALFTLAIVLQRVAYARAAEWGLGRLRGVPRLRWLSSVYVEPTVALLLGGVVGVWAGVAAAGLVVRHELRPGTPIDVWRWPVLAAAAAAVLGALVALVVVSLRSVRRPLVGLLQQTSEGRRLTLAGAIGQTAILLLAAVSLYQLLTGGALGTGGSQLGLLAPASFSLALAVLAVRVAVVMVGRVTARPSRSRAALVVGRRAARVPSSLNPAVLVAAGLALALFATQTWVLSVRNQDLRADATTGADAVLKLTVPAGTDLIAAVRRADPSGRYAMAAQEKATSADGGTSRIVAVDSTRLAAVTSWSPAWSGVEDIAGSLRGSTTPSISLRGTSVTVRLVDVHVSVSAGISPGSGRTADIAASDLVPPTVSLVLDTGAAWVSASLGPLVGDGDRRAEIPCARSCRVVGIELQSTEGSAYQSSFVVAGIGTDLEPMARSASWLADAPGWQERVADQSSPQPLAGSSPASTAVACRSGPSTTRAVCRPWCPGPTPPTRCRPCSGRPWQRWASPGCRGSRTARD